LLPAETLSARVSRRIALSWPRHALLDDVPTELGIHEAFLRAQNGSAQICIFNPLPPAHIGQAILFYKAASFILIL
jgi:hypothetical protein